MTGGSAQRIFVMLNQDHVSHSTECSLNLCCTYKLDGVLPWANINRNGNRFFGTTASHTAAIKRPQFMRKKYLKNKLGPLYSS